MPKLNTTIFDKNYKKLLHEEKEIEEQLSELQEHLAEIKEKISAYRLVSEECIVTSAESGEIRIAELRRDAPERSIGYDCGT